MKIIRIYQKVMKEELENTDELEEKICYFSDSLHF